MFISTSGLTLGSIDRLVDLGYQVVIEADSEFAEITKIPQEDQE